jgi:hypothetical protein
MRKLDRETRFDCSPETFWNAFWDPEFNRKLYLEALGFREIEILEQTDVTRRMRAVPKLDMPGPLVKVLGDRFGYEERGKLDRARGEWRWSTIPNALGDKIRTEGVLRIVSDGSGCRRLDEVTIEAKVFGIGGLIESTAEKQLRASWEKEAVFTKSWLSAAR